MQPMKMLTLVFTVILLSISHCTGDTCYCTCCAGNRCTPTLQGSITVSSCASSSCESTCQASYPAQCTNGAGSTIYQCRSGSVPALNWVGDFIMSSRCDVRSCCCPTGQATLTRTNGNYLRIQSVFAGQCPGGTSSFDQTITMPTGYTAQIVFLNEPVQLTLSQDSTTVQILNPLYPSCSEIATRNSALSVVTINLALVFLLSGLMSFRQCMM